MSAGPSTATLSFLLTFKGQLLFDVSNARIYITLLFFGELLQVHVGTHLCRKVEGEVTLPRFRINRAGRLRRFRRRHR